MVAKKVKTPQQLAWESWWRLMRPSKIFSLQTAHQAGYEDGYQAGLEDGMKVERNKKKSEASVMLSTIPTHIETALDKQAQEVERLRRVCRDVYDVWAGSEGIPQPETAPEAYLLHLVEQMRDEAKKGLTRG